MGLDTIFHNKKIDKIHISLSNKLNVNLMVFCINFQEESFQFLIRDLKLQVLILLIV